MKIKKIIDLYNALDNLFKKTLSLDQIHQGCFKRQGVWTLTPFNFPDFYDFHGTKTLSDKDLIQKAIQCPILKICVSGGRDEEYTVSIHVNENLLKEFRLNLKKTQDITGEWCFIVLLVQETIKQSTKKLQPST